MKEASPSQELVAIVAASREAAAAAAASQAQAANQHMSNQQHAASLGDRHDPNGVLKPEQPVSAQLDVSAAASQVCGQS